MVRHGALVPGRPSADAARGEDGALVKNPAAQLMRDATAQLRALAIQLGFTPDVRDRVDTGTAPAESGVRDPARLLTQ